MSAPPFFTDAAKAQAAKTVRAIKSRTAAEVVITVHTTSGSYRHTDYLVGFLLSLAALVAMLFLPQEFFAPGAVLSFLTGILPMSFTPTDLVQIWTDKNRLGLPRFSTHPR